MCAGRRGLAYKSAFYLLPCTQHSINQETAIKIISWLSRKGLALGFFLAPFVATLPIETLPSN